MDERIHASNWIFVEKIKNRKKEEDYEKHQKYGARLNYEFGRICLSALRIGQHKLLKTGRGHQSIA